MQHIVHINARVQRIDAEKQNRSDALNRTLTEANRTIVQLKAELFATRVVSAFALFGMGFALFRSLTGVQ